MKTIPGNTQIKNLDVLGLDREPKLRVLKGAPGELASDPYLSIVCPYPAQPDRQHKPRRRYRTSGNKYVSVPQADPLVGHGCHLMTMTVSASPRYARAYARSCFAGISRVA